MGGEGIQMVAAPPGFTCWDGVSETTLEAALSPPAAGCIEADLIGERDWDVVFTRGAWHKLCYWWWNYKSADGEAAFRSLRIDGRRRDVWLQMGWRRRLPRDM